MSPSMPKFSCWQSSMTHVKPDIACLLTRAKGGLYMVRINYPARDRVALGAASSILRLCNVRVLFRKTEYAILSEGNSSFLRKKSLGFMNWISGNIFIFCYEITSSKEKNKSLVLLTKTLNLIFCKGRYYLFADSDEFLFLFLVFSVRSE